jgi:protein O-GlcNAc transferase
MRVSLAIAVAVLLRVPARAQDASAALGEGLEQLRQARFEAAADSFRRAVDLDPSLRIAQYDLAICYFAEGQFEKAEKAFERTLQFSPDNLFAQYYLARISLIQNRLAEAISSFERLTRHGPVADEYYYLGSAYWQKGDLLAAVQALKRAAELKPADSRVHYLLARVYRREGNTAEAEEELRRSRRSAGDFSEGGTAAQEL